jgi:hypothetical protein
MPVPERDPVPVQKACLNNVVTGAVVSQGKVTQNCFDDDIAVSAKNFPLP